MFTNFGIILFDLYLLRHGALVLGGGVEVSGSGGGYQFNLVTHDNSLFIPSRHGRAFQIERRRCPSCR